MRSGGGHLDRQQDSEPAGHCEVGVNVRVQWYRDPEHVDAGRRSVTDPKIQ